MDRYDKSIRDQIDCLARLTGAPESFVGQVRELFVRKGISLDSDSSPYIKALEEAFIREENIRANADRARKQVGQLKSSVRRLSEVYARQMDRLREVRSKLRAEALEDRPGSPRSAAPLTLMTPQQNDDLPLVPGPDEVQ